MNPTRRAKATLKGWDVTHKKTGMWLWLPVELCPSAWDARRSAAKLLGGGLTRRRVLARELKATPRSA